MKREKFLWVKIMLSLSLCFVVNIELAAIGPEEAVFRRFSQSNGLSQNSVFSIAQDNQGFLWFATRDGLNRYDGYNFTLYHHKHGEENTLVGNDVRALYFDAGRKAMWIGTLEGLSRLDLVTNRFTNYKYGVSGLSSNYILTIYEDRSGRLLVGTRAGLDLYDPETDSFRQVAPAPGVKAPAVHSITEDKQGRIWLGTATGLAALKESMAGVPHIVKGGTVALTYPEAPAEEEIQVVFFDRSEKFWAGTEKSGLFCWPDSGASPVVYRHNRNKKTSLSNDNVRTIAQDAKGNIWIGTFLGLNRLVAGETAFQRFLHDDRNQASLSHNSIRKIFIDKQGGLWAGTYHGGVSYYHPNLANFRQYRQDGSPASLSNNIVSDIVGTGGNKFWIGTEGGGLNYFDYEANTFKAFLHQENNRNSLSGNNVKSLLWDGEGLWVGTFDAGLNYFKPDVNEWQQYQYKEGKENGLSSNNVYDLLLEENRLWIMTFGAGLDMLNLETGEFENFSTIRLDSTSLSSNQGRVLLRDSKGRFWAGTENGLNLRVDGGGSTPHFQRLLQGRRVYSLTEAADGKIWAGTLNDGLFVLDPDDFSWLQFTEVNGLPGHSIFGILQDNQGMLWLSTNNGIVSFDPESMHATAFSIAAGLQNLEYNFNGYYKAGSGDLFFGGLQGLTVFSPENFRPDSTPPTIVFTDLKRANRKVPISEDGLLQQALNYTDELVFDYNSANFSIGFALIDYLDPANSQYAYRLEGLEPDWTFSRGESEATYTIQRSGDYVFRLKGANGKGVWNNTERTISIKVLPPPWRSGWAYLAYSILVIGLVYGLFRFVRLRHRLDLERIAKEQQKAAHESRLRFFTNITHEFRTPLTLILGPLQDLLQKHRESSDYERMVGIERNTKRLLNLVNQILIFRKMEADHAPLNTAREDVIAMLKDIFLSFKETARIKNIDFLWEVETDSLYFEFDRDKLDKVFFNLLSNAFTFTPKGGRVALCASLVNARFEVSVRNTGRGISPENIPHVFERFYEDHSTAGNNTGAGSGIGLALSRQLVELHDGKITVESEPGVETRFIVRLPLGPTAHIAFANVPDTEIQSPALAVPDSEDGKVVVSKSPAGKQRGRESSEPLLLIVEDNPEVSAYLENIFKPYYRLVCAPNGQEGLRQTRSLQPDLVISDVMMPEMDGETMCRHIKEDISTSHVPVILLTARSIEPFKIGGLRAGADDYITKPFNPEELRLRVENTLTTRRRFREGFGKVMSLDPSPVQVTTLDEAFLQQALEIAEENIGNSDFKVEEFARQLAVSRALLFTKLKALTGKTPNKFLRGLRLKRAAQLLVDSDFQVSRIAAQVGFKDVRYFSKCFQQYFEATPTEFRMRGK
ncbi:response regulator [Neolewinella aurantiaca]|uniref:histidine kinase n=1 Tax=Neolewinella aurantiaca TaxID=2602767 RepID=A0A5C7FYS4_9BACT|nr:hybrid sensor histidine kinase/response regulator transcription factor [Neolewinella aurantiaca]TXF91766.1 response regulator [Neolewinella aurantiaca]